jgi:hypothetical protein
MRKKYVIHEKKYVIHEKKYVIHEKKVRDTCEKKTKVLTLSLFNIY